MSNSSSLQFNTIQERHLELKTELRNDQLIHSHVTKYGNNYAEFVHNGSVILWHKFIILQTPFEANMLLVCVFL